MSSSSVITATADTSTSLAPGWSTNDTAEYVVPVEWVAVRDRTEGFWQSGMFANQHSACRLSNKFTIDRLTDHFKLDDGERG
ncbi:hypothetical protein F9C11_23150 [Amycolatopsis sp. VS8301801F10]|uniref:hypothetical protein n=1 Tax=unclassified Amycolatopsis TaxID=2618356 RepID=UPI0038FC9712